MRLELTILSALAPQASVYTIPPSGQKPLPPERVGNNGSSDRALTYPNYYVVMPPPGLLVRLEGLEPSINEAADFKSAVYTIPPQSHYRFSKSPTILLGGLTGLSRMSEF